MRAETNRSAQSFGAGGNLYFVIGLFGTFFLGLFSVVARKNGEWGVVMIIAGIIAALLLMLQVLKFKIGPDGFVYRTLISSTAFDFDDISKAGLTVTYSGSTPQGIGNLRVEMKDGRKSEVNLRLYVIKAAATLFNELERRGIPIEVPNLWAAQRMMNQIRKAQSKLRV
jgi:hypothetical protein